jgi:hypothetical protein
MPVLIAGGHVPFGSVYPFGSSPGEQQPPMKRPTAKVEIAIRNVRLWFVNIGKLQM